MNSCVRITEYDSKGDPIILDIPAHGHDSTAFWDSYISATMRSITKAIPAKRDTHGADEHAPRTRYARLTSCPAELAKLLRDTGETQLSEVYCTSDCNPEDCTPEHELVCIEKWLMQTEDKK